MKSTSELHRLGDGPDQAARRGSDTPPAVGGQGPRIRTLVRLRWLAIAGQAAAVGVVGVWLKVAIPVGPCLALIAASALVNLALTLWPAARRAARRWGASAHLGFDILQLSALLFLTGGVVNPFSLLLIAPVTIGAATLPSRDAAGLGVLAIALSIALAAAPAPAPWAMAGTASPSGLYPIACVVALVVGIAVTGGYASWAAGEAARMELALHVTERVLAREQRLSALGALAAAAAHELGTPLATIAVVAKELSREAPEGAMRDDADILVAQAQRCRDILRRLAETPEVGDALHERMSLLQFVGEILGPYAGEKAVRAEAVVTGPPGMAAPDLWRRPDVLHAISAMVENAFDFARGEILVTARFDAEAIAIEVRDDGPGFAPAVLARLGEPYVTSRPGAEGSRTGHVGMGLGFFIAKTLLERGGAAVAFANRDPAGAVVTVRWPRARMEALADGGIGRRLAP